MALTKRDVDRLAWDPDGPKIQLHPDGELPGFSVRVYPTGKKSFVLRYRPLGATQPKLLTIGAYGALTLDQARRLARTELLKVKTGGDPVEERRKARQGETMKRLAVLYLERHAKRHKKTWKEDDRRIKKHVLPTLGNRRVSEVKRSDIARLHARIGDTAPYEANRVLALLAVMFGKAQEWGLLEETAANPASRVQPFKERSRDRWAQPEELPQLWKAIETEPNLYRRAAFKLYLFTGMRRNELLRLRWKDVDLARREIRLSDTKAGRAHIVPLSEPALAILKQLPRQLGNAHVFPGRVKGQPLVNIAKSWRSIRARLWLAMNPERAAELRAEAVAEVEGRPKHAGKGPAAIEARLLALARKEAQADNALRLHDLRRTVGALMATSGTSLGIVGKVLNHTTPSATAIYARIAEDATRTALEEHGRRILPLLEGRPTFPH